MQFQDVNEKTQQELLTLAEGRLRRLQPGDQIDVRFTSRYRRPARVTRIGRGEIRFIQTYVAATGEWSKERKLTAYDLVP